MLRAEAGDERAVLIQERLLGGEDPWAFMEELPTTDELVVLLLRAEYIQASGGVRPDTERNYRILRRIALDYPPLTPAVWRMLGEGEAHRLWHLSAVDQAS